MKPNNIKGFTLIELMVVISIIGIMATLAAPDFTAFRRKSELRSSMSDFLNSVNLARANALKTGLNTYIIPASGQDWSTGWSVYQDTDLSNSLTEADTVLQSHAAVPKSITVDTTTASAFLDSNSSTRYVAYAANGYPKVNGGGGGSNGQLIFQISPNNTEKSSLMISRSGKARICKTGSTGCTANDTY